VKIRVTQIGRRTAERTLKIGNLVHLHRWVDERDVVKRTRIEQTFSVADGVQLLHRALLWLVGLPLPVLSACWDWCSRIFQR